MLTVLTGDNVFALQDALDKMVKAYVSKHGDLGLERIDGREADLSRIREALTNAPLLAARKLVVIKDLGANKDAIGQVEQLFDDIPETTDAVVVEPKFDKRLNYYKFLKKHADFQEFTELDPAGLSRWLVEAARKSEGSLGFADARYLVERVGPDQQLLSNELEKLLLYDTNITRSTIDLLTDPAPQSTVFQLLEAAFAGDKRRALRLYAEQRAQNVEPPQIIAMLAWQLHVLAVIKTAGERSADVIAKEAGINPFVVKKSQGVARGLSTGRIKKLVADLLRIDTSIKRTSSDPDEALRHYLLSMALLKQA